MDTKEIVALTEKWLQEIKQITVNYTIAVARLEKAQQDYERQTKKWYYIILPYVMPLITAIIFIIIFVIIVQYVGCPNPINIKWMDLEITQTCKA